jgi:hypothetical protein
VDFEGDPVTNMAWSPTDPSVIAVSYEDGKVAMVDLSKLGSDPNQSMVDISSLVKRAPVEGKLMRLPMSRIAMQPFRATN